MTDPRDRAGTMAQGPDRGRSLPVAGWLLAVAATAALVMGSRLPLGEGDVASGEIVLSWRNQETAVQVCRDYTEEELARLPAHMVGAGVCERSIPTRTLSVRIDGALQIDRILEPGGRSHDRPITVLERIPTPVGSHQLSVEFAPVDGGSPGGATVLRLETTVVVAPGEVLLVTLDERTGALTTRSGSDEDSG